VIWSQLSYQTLGVIASLFLHGVLLFVYGISSLLTPTPPEPPKAFNIKIVAAPPVNISEKPKITPPLQKKVRLQPKLQPQVKKISKKTMLPKKDLKIPKTEVPIRNAPQESPPLSKKDNTPTKPKIIEKPSLEKKPKHKNPAKEEKQIKTLDTLLTQKEESQSASLDTLLENTVKHSSSGNINQGKIAQMVNVIRNQIQLQWNIPANARGKNINVVAELHFNRQGFVEKFQILDARGSTKNLIYHTVRESVIRTLQKPSWQPLRFSEKDYGLWKSIIITFNPQGS
jgi:hypothetical protein